MADSVQGERRSTKLAGPDELGENSATLSFSVNLGWQGAYDQNCQRFKPRVTVVAVIGAIPAFLLGIVSVQHLAELPTASQLAAIAGLALLAAWRRYWRLLACLLGLLWASLFAVWRLADGLSGELQARDIVIEGYIAGVPRQLENRLGFDFVAIRAQNGFPSKVRLNWYQPPLEVKAGQVWRLTVKVKQPHGRINPGGFDYEAWLFANHIGATGYVRPKPEPERLDAAAMDFSAGRYLAEWRQSVSERLDRELSGCQQLGVIKALTIGSQDGIGQDQWQIFRTTGTIHLIVISGSHISLIAGLAFYWARRIWARFSSLKVAPQNAAAWLAWWVAVVYSALAGFTVPTQRALVMLTVGLFAIAGQRHVSTVQVLLLALLAVLVFDPLAVLSVGFWLSFLAVALLLFVTLGRLGRAGWWREALRAQWVTAIGLSPLLIMFFQQVSLISPLANWLAVPVIGVVVVPLALLALIISYWFEPASIALFQLLDWILQALYWLLEHMAAWPIATVSVPEPPWYALLLAMIGVALLLAPRGLPYRYLGVVLWLPVVCAQIDRPKAGEAWLTLLDVGQGLAAVVETEQHALVFDTGARYSEQSDMGDSVLLPYLRFRDIRGLDMLLVSHGDNDHAGGAETLLAEMPVKTILSSVAEFAERPTGGYCRAGGRWQWDGVAFEVLSPFESGYDGDNDNSCVLKVSAAAHGFLLTGDIERTAEAGLVQHYGEDLASSVLIAPHHGSKTSSSREFLQRVEPAWVLIPAGHMNRFGFPHPSVLARYRELGARWLSSAESGAITVRSRGGELELTAERQRQARYWMRAGVK